MHEFLDKYSVAMTQLILKDKWFESSLESDSLIELTKKINMEAIKSLQPSITELEVKYNGSSFDPAFEVIKWLGYDYPTLIYHHGNNERPFSYKKTSKNTFKSIIYPHVDTLNCNIITIRAPFHNGTLKEFTTLMKDLSNFTAMIAISTNLIEQIIVHLKSNQSPKVTVVGLSLGGWIVNLHRSVYNTAHQYIPIFAGASLDSLFTDSFYKKLVSEEAILERSHLHDILNFEKNFKLVKEANVFPVLAKFDQYIDYTTQKESYSSYPVVVLNKGHITGALDSTRLYNHIQNYI